MWSLDLLLNLLNGNGLFNIPPHINTQPFLSFAYTLIKQFVVKYMLFFILEGGETHTFWIVIGGSDTLLMQLNVLLCGALSAVRHMALHFFIFPSQSWLVEEHQMFPSLSHAVCCIMSSLAFLVSLRNHQDMRASDSFLTAVLAVIVLRQK